MKKFFLNAIILLLTYCSFAQTMGEVNIGQRTIVFNDESRKRPLITEVWYPTTDTLKTSDKFFSPFIRNYTVRDGKLPINKLPLVMLSHGTGGGRLTLEWLAYGLAQAGFIVAAVDHWGNTYDNKIPLQFFEFWQRPQDISFVLTALLNNSIFKTAIDQQQIGAIGFSFGGYTVLGLAGAVADVPHMLTYYKTVGKKEIEFPEFPGLSRMLEDSTLIADSKNIPNLKDSRIKSFFAICPGTGAGFSKRQQMKDITAPVYIIGVQADSIVPVEQNARHYNQLIVGSHYYEFAGKVSHYVMLNEAIDEVKKSDPIFADDPSVSRRQVHAKVDSIAVEFFNRNLR